VKDHPKGLMRVTFVSKTGAVVEPADANRLWFFSADLGKHRYGNILLTEGEKYAEFAPLGKEGDYAEWAKNSKRGYGIVRYHIEGDSLTMSGPEHPAMEALAKAEMFLESGGIWRAKPGWLKKHLETKEADKLFARTDTYRRIKK
jgi:hypothetical protein